MAPIKRYVEMLLDAQELPEANLQFQTYHFAYFSPYPLNIINLIIGEMFVCIWGNYRMIYAKLIQNFFHVKFIYENLGNLRQEQFIELKQHC